MAREVIIEGSRVTPGDRLGRGKRAKVQLTSDIITLINNGTVTVVDQTIPDGVLTGRLDPQTWTPGDSPILPEVPDSAYGPDSVPLDPPSVEPDLKPPAKNGSTDDWKAWVQANVADADVDGKSRDDLIAIWEKWQGRSVE